MRFKVQSALLRLAVNRSSKSCDTAVGDGNAVGASRKNSCSLKRDRASAIRSVLLPWKVHGRDYNPETVVESVASYLRLEMNPVEPRC